MAYSLKDAVHHLLNWAQPAKHRPEGQFAKVDAETDAERKARLERLREQEIFFWGVFPIL